MTSNRHSEFHEFSDIPACIVGTIGVVYWDGDGGLSGFESVLLNEASVDGATHTAAVQ